MNETKKILSKEVLVVYFLNFQQQPSNVCENIQFSK